MFLEINQCSAMLIINCCVFSLMMSPLRLSILYSVFRAAGCRMYRLLSFMSIQLYIQDTGHSHTGLYKSHVALLSRTHFPFEWTLFSFWLKRWTQSMVLPACTDPLSNHESVPAHTLWDCVIKYRGYTLQQWGEHGTPPKNPLPSNFNPPDVSFLRY